MSALGMISGIFRGGVVEVRLKNSARSNKRQGIFWEVAKCFGSSLLEKARGKGLGLSGLPVWSCQLMLGIVGQSSCYWVFCYYPGQPKILTLDLDKAEPDSADQLLASLKIEFAEPIHAFRLPLSLVDSDDAVPGETIGRLADDYLRLLLGVALRIGDEPSAFELLLAVTTTTSPVPHDQREALCRPGWRVRLRPLADSGDLEKYLLEAFQAPTLELSSEDGGLYLRCEDFAAFEEPLDVFNHGSALLRAATGILRLWGFPLTELEAENAEKVNSDGSVEGLRTSAKGSVAVLSKGGRKALLQLVSSSSQLRLVDLMVPLALNDLRVRRVLNIMANPNCDWADLYTALEIAVDAAGGEKAIENKGWSSAGEIGLFKHTANTAEFGRHGHPFVPPKRPMSLVEARHTVMRVLRGWIAEESVRSRRGS
jgi:hypothetical protein